MLNQVIQVPFITIYRILQQAWQRELHVKILHTYRIEGYTTIGKYFMYRLKLYAFHNFTQCPRIQRSNTTVATWAHLRSAGKLHEINRKR